MTQNKMVYPGTRSYQEQKKELAKKRKDCGKREENGDHSSNNPYKTQMILNDEECAVHTFTVF
jgi:hypothetical protein